MHEFNISPDRWALMPVDSRAEMMAYIEVKGLMSLFRAEQPADA